MRDQRHLGRDAARGGKRAHDVEARHLDQYDRHVHVLPQVGAVGAACNHHVEPAFAHFTRYRAGGGLEALADDAEFRACGVGRNQVGKGARKAADTDGPDARAGGRGRGWTHGAVRRGERVKPCRNRRTVLAHCPSCQARFQL
ncbi:hypothetical protein D3C81_1463690 [compost metagenome]